MFFTLRELLRWLGITVFEIFVALASFLVFTVLLVLKLEGSAGEEGGPVLGDLSWWWVFAPLFVSDAVNTYFCVIIFIRMQVECNYKSAVARALWSLSSLFLLFLYKYLHCKKLEGSASLEYSEVLSPLFVHLQFVMIRACHLH